MDPTLSLADYLAAGGKLTAPGNVTPRYRAELLRLLATFVDSSLAGAAGFADTINAGPGIAERIAAARIVMEKTQNAARILRLMGEFGADIARYAGSHPWAARLPRKADIGAERSEHDMRLAVFNYPLAGWDDAVVMNLLMGQAAVVQLADFQTISYQPAADAFRAIAPVEAAHRDLAHAGLAQRIAAGADRSALEASVRYWWPRVAVSFGGGSGTRQALLHGLGLRHQSAGDQRSAWEDAAARNLEGFGLTPGA